MSLRVEVEAAGAVAAELDADPGLAPLVEDAARAACAAEGVGAAELTLTLLDDDGITALNERWLAHQGPTDVIAFPLHEEGEEPVGDVYLGYSQALRQAAELDVPPREELVRLAVHGTLHVLGWDHPAGPEREDTPMWQRQEEIVREVLARGQEGEGA